MGVGRQCAALAGLEIHHVVAQRSAPQRQRRPWASSSRARLMPKLRVGGFGPGDRLEHQVDRRAALHQLNRRGDMGQHAGLGRDPVALDAVRPAGEQVFDADRLSVAGLMPITASPLPYSRPSSIEAAIRADRRWGGWAAGARRAGRAGRGYRERLITRHFAPPESDPDCA